MKILTAKQMGEVDRLTTERYGIPSLLLMENAGRSVADELEKACPGLDRRIRILCGTGNNGGDGLVVARHLISRGCSPEVWILGDPDRFRGDALENWNMFRSLGRPPEVLADPADRLPRLQAAPPADVFVDALFGTGLSKPLGEDFRPVVDWLNSIRAHAFVASVDLPSGVFADSGMLPGPAVQAHLTVTFTALKPALVFTPASEKAGRVVIVPIGSPADLLWNPGYRMELVDRDLVRRTVPRRPRAGHKGTFGHVFVLAGSRDKCGAALMAGLAALRSGAGLVTLMLPESLRPDLLGKAPELMTVWLPETPEGTADMSAAGRVLDLLSQADAVVVGPGLSTHPSTRELVRAVVEDSPAPVVLDADGINSYASDSGRLRNGRGNPIAITPHPGEMARLIDAEIAMVQERRLEVAEEFSAKNNLFTVLKGHQTVVASPGGRLYVNSTGNPGMASGGTGDILAGMMGRFAAGWRRSPGRDDREALGEFICAAVYLHGHAGDLAAAQKGEESLIATDLLGSLPESFKSLWRE